MKPVIIFKSILFVLSFVAAGITTNGQTISRLKTDTVGSLTNLKKRIVTLKVNRKLYYRMQKVHVDKISYGEGDADAAGNNENNTGIDSGRVFTPAPAANSANFFAGSTDCKGNLFAGKDRAVVKTHAVTANPVIFTTINALFASGILVPDAVMRNSESGVKKSPESERVPAERKTVTVKKAFLYGIYREGDNDFHVIIGNGLSGDKRILFNIEISALPGDNLNSGLNKPRNEIIKRFGDLKCSDGAFKPIDVLIPIMVKGSLFYDIDHAPGIVGFGKFKPKTAWEMHPVQVIAFLDE
jgi:hypothetical protein